MNLSTVNQTGTVVIETDTMLMGEVNGNVIVLPGAKLDLEAKVTGDVTLKKFSVASIRGQINGNLYNEGARIELIRGVRGEVINR
ncbi:MAG: hypothetical protein LPK26_21645 [Bacillaceae bacterium]|uniref:Polymer-forming cytoskeletal protein n=1 Tax=Alkalihalobacterium chitinilyticum TaxID=2980103 RepID=A0ABT5VLD4_9BACI|nr:hypothetical protein [Alkalihalobacterium chitinilyticum]MDE5416261.1 hypothetical protein [Alkalihalobacterium chitinilyticum]MEB1809862.1 hypothetical protein [Bacillaceae bacterium]